MIGAQTPASNKPPARRETESSRRQVRARMRGMGFAELAANPEYRV
jgi:hypothetical protein